MTGTVTAAAGLKDPNHVTCIHGHVGDNSKDSGEDMPQKDANQTLGWMHSAATFLSPFVLIALGGLFTWMDKIDNRQYMMKDEYLSKPDFNMAVTRLESAIDIKMMSIQANGNARHDESGKQMTRILDELAKLNTQLNTLAVELEKKTK